MKTNIIKFRDPRPTDIKRKEINLAGLVEAMEKASVSAVDVAKGLRRLSEARWPAKEFVKGRFDGTRHAQEAIDALPPLRKKPQAFNPDF